jgi:Kdo2-lipid IVA lauroyltransferase/acyltransferase
MVSPAAAAPAEAPRQPTLAHRAQYAALRTLIGGLSVLPFTTAAAIGGRLARIGRWPLGIRRDVVERQIAAAFPERSHEEVEELARRSYDHLGRLTVESALLPKLGSSGLMRLFEGAEGWDHLERGLAAGRGVLIVTGHLGNWELCGGYVAARGVALDVVVRRMGNPLFDRYLNATRRRIGMRVVYDNEAVRRLTRSMREGRAAALLADQGVKNLASTYAPFFGRPAKTPRGPAVLALRWDVPLLFVTAVRMPTGRYRCFIEELVVRRTDDREADVEALVLAFTQTLERYVRRFPEQYFWQHRRWKRQPPDTPVELRDPAVEVE